MASPARRPASISGRCSRPHCAIGARKALDIEQLSRRRDGFEASVRSTGASSSLRHG